MQKKNKNLLLTLASSAVLFASLAQAAHAQAIYVRDDDDDVLNYHLGNIQGGITGNSIKGQDATGFLFDYNYNTNAFLSYTQPADANYNTNNMLRWIMSEVGGCYTQDDPTTCSTGHIFGSATSTKGRGVATSYFNTNTILRNSFLGSSGTEINVVNYALGPAPDSRTNVTALVNNAKNGPFGALLVSPTQIKDVTEAGTDVGVTATIGTAMWDMLRTIEMSWKSATARTVGDPRVTAIGEAYVKRCENGFNPTYAQTITVTDVDPTTGESFPPVQEPIDPEGYLNSRMSTCKSGYSKKYVRTDRSLESLLGPLQYIAPNDMAPATTGEGRVNVRLPSKLNSDKYAPIYAAAGFCQNITQNASPLLITSETKEDATDVLNKAMLHETHDSRLVANCWHFFEERVQYPDGVGRHLAQQNRCKVDHEIRHIISAQALTDCETNGRSTLRARADMAYRMDSFEYINYLNTLGVTVREQLMAAALDAPERFEQDLLIERHIMTGAMAAARSKAMTYGEETSPEVVVGPTGAFGGGGGGGRPVTGP